MGPPGSQVGWHGSPPNPGLPAHLGSCARRQRPVWRSPFRPSSALTSARLPARQHRRAVRSPQTPTALRRGAASPTKPRTPGTASPRDPLSSPPGDSQHHGVGGSVQLPGDGEGRAALSERGHPEGTAGTGGSPAMGFTSHGGVRHCWFGGQNQHMAWGDTVAFIAPGFVASLGLSVGEKAPFLRFSGCGAASPAAVGFTCLCHQPHLQRGPSWDEAHGLPGHQCHHLCSAAAPQGWNIFSLPHRGTGGRRDPAAGTMCPNPHAGAGIGTGSRMPPWHPKKLQGGLKTSPGDCTLPRCLSTCPSLWG